MTSRKPPTNRRPWYVAGMHLCSAVLAFAFAYGLSGDHPGLAWVVRVGGAAELGAALWVISQVWQARKQADDEG